MQLVDFPDQEPSAWQTRLADPVRTQLGSQKYLTVDWYTVSGNWRRPLDTLPGSPQLATGKETQNIKYSSCNLAIMVSILLLQKYCRSIARGIFGGKLLASFRFYILDLHSIFDSMVLHTALQMFLLVNNDLEENSLVHVVCVPLHCPLVWHVRRAVPPTLQPTSHLVKIL